MNELPNGFNLGSLYGFPTGTPAEGVFAYIPNSPAVHLMGGRPALSLLAMPAGSMLNCQATWQAAPAEIAQAQTELAARYPTLSAPYLQPAQLEEITATLTVKLETVSPLVIGPNPSSGMSSNAVVFSASLTPAAADAVKAALGGKRGILTLAYTGTLALDESATTAFTGDLAATVKQLAPKPAPQTSGGMFGFGKKKPEPEPAPPPTPQACSAALDAAIAAGSIAVVQTNTPNVSPALSRQVTQDLHDRVVKMLLDKVKLMGAGAEALGTFPIHLSNTLPETRTIPITRSIDLADALAQP